MQLTAAAEDSQGHPVGGAVISWSIAGPSVASVTTSGRLTAVAVGNTSAVATSGGKSASVDVHVVSLTGGAVLNVLPGQTFQTMTGWEGTVQIGEQQCSANAMSTLRTSILDRAVTELGLNRVRLEIKSGAENPIDYVAQFYAGSITAAQLSQYTYEIINDNSNPNVLNAAGFHFTGIDRAIETVVLPMRQRLASRGEQLFVNLNYVDFKSSAFEHHDYPAEYGEFMFAVFDHMQKKYGFVPDAVEIVLEPDNAQWTGAQIGRAIVAAGDRLKASGWRPEFIAPSTASMSGALTYARDVLQQPRVLEYLTDLSYHRYSGVSNANVKAIADLAAQNGLRTAMLEKIGAGYEQLHEDLADGRVSSWQQYTIAFCTNDSGAQYYVIDQNASPPRLLIGDRTKFLRQYFLFVRRDAVRVGATTTSSQLQPLAFRNANGKFVVVVKAGDGETFSVSGLPAGQYGIKFTTPSQYDVDLADATIAAGEMVSTTIPTSGVITIYQR